MSELLEKLCRDRRKQTDVDSKDSIASTRSKKISNNKKEKNVENINRKEINKKEAPTLGVLHLYLILCSIAIIFINTLNLFFEF